MVGGNARPDQPESRVALVERLASSVLEWDTKLGVVGMIALTQPERYMAFKKLTEGVVEKLVAEARSKGVLDEVIALLRNRGKTSALTLLAWFVPVDGMMRCQAPPRDVAPCAGGMVSAPKIKFSCQKCGARYSVDERHAGKGARCKQCSATIVVPAR
jgi:DNA-directed RNA polymerase subunit RPC12/RpoP